MHVEPLNPPLAAVPMSRSWIRTLHAGAALVFMVLFFVTAVAAALGLIYLGYHAGLGALATLRGKAMLFGLLVALGMVVAGLVIAWSLLPRFDRFVAPGPELRREEHPALFRELDRVAALIDEQSPKHVYLVGDVNAFVAERGGFMGLGSRRVMGLGLALLNVLTVSELRAVLAHEFGHFAGGDTSLGRWIHKTRLALVRTLNNLGETGNALSEVGALAVVFAVVHAPFRWFFAFYMRFTQALSRRQEFDADAVAAQLEGSAALISGLTTVRRAAVAHQLFLGCELGPLISKGLLPPIGEGFRHFVGEDAIDAEVSRMLDQDEAPEDPWDSHPPLAHRIAALQRLGGPKRATDERLAVELLRNVSVLEAAVAQTWVDGPLQAISWPHAGRP